MTDCVHHWLLAPSGNGPTSPAVCKRCGAERVYGNVFALDMAAPPAPEGYYARAHIDGAYTWSPKPSGKRKPSIGRVSRPTQPTSVFGGRHDR